MRRGRRKKAASDGHHIMPDFRQSELGIACRHDQIASQTHLEAAADGIAFDRRNDHGLRGGRFMMPKPPRAILARGPPLATALRSAPAEKCRRRR